MSDKKFAATGFNGIKIGTYTSSTVNTPVISDIAGTRFFEQYVKCNAASGDTRAQYTRMDFIKANSGGGDAVRAYAIAKKAIGTMQGLHATAQIGGTAADPGSITGLICGARATLATSADLTISGGTGHALRLDSDLNSAVTGMTMASFIGAFDLQSAKLPFFLNTSAGADSATTALRYKAAGYTAGALKGGLRCMVGTVELWIPLYDGMS